MKNINLLAISAVLTSLALTVQAQSPTTFSGNSNTGFGGAVGNGNLVLSDNGTNLTITLNSASALGGNDLVLYIDSIAGGYSSTAGFNDAADGGRSAVSGYTQYGNSGGSGQSVLTFASGFSADYAIDIGNTYASLFGLNNGGNNSLNFITGASQSGASPYTVIIPLIDLGLTPGAGQTIELFGTFISESGYRSTEAIAGNDTGVQGWNAFTQIGTIASYTTVTATPEPSTMMLSASGLATLLLFRRRR